jgi:hypothetical protein
MLILSARKQEDRMKKIMVCFWLLLFNNLIGDTIKEVIFQPNDEEYKQFMKHTFFYNERNELIKVETYLSDIFSEEKGYFKQTEIIKEGFAYSFEMIFTEKNTEITGIKKRIDYVDKNDNITYIEFTFDNSRKYKIDGKYIKVLDKFKISKMNKYLNIYNELQLEDKIFSIEAPIFSGMSNVENTNQIVKIDEKEKDLIKKWQQAHKLNDISEKYNNKIKVKENDKEYWVFIQDNVIKFIKDFDSILLYYYYIGGYYKNNPVFVMIDFFE